MPERAPEAALVERLAGLDDEELLVVGPGHELLDEAQRAGQVLDREVEEGAHLVDVGLVLGERVGAGVDDAPGACSSPAP